MVAGHHGPAIPKPTLAYFQQRLRNRVFDLLLERFDEEKKKGLTKAILARRIGKTPDVINRWLGSPSNLTLDTLSDLMIGLAAEEILMQTFSPVKQEQHNYSHFAELASTERHMRPRQGAAAEVTPRANALRYGAAAAGLEPGRNANRPMRAAGAA